MKAQLTITRVAWRCWTYDIRYDEQVWVGQAASRKAVMRMTARVLREIGNEF